MLNASRPTGVVWKRERKHEWRSGNVWAGPCITTLLYLYSRSLWFTKMSYYEEFSTQEMASVRRRWACQYNVSLKRKFLFIPSHRLQCRCCETWHPRKARGPLPDSQKSNQMTEQWVQTCSDSMQTDMSGVNDSKRKKLECHLEVLKLFGIN